MATKRTEGGTHTGGASADVGLVGLGVMGQNLALNMADHGHRVAVHNRTAAATHAFLAANPNTPGGLVGVDDVGAFVRAIKRPRRVIVLVKAGGATDAVIDGLRIHMEKGDVVIDLGNAHWEDTIRRERALRAMGLHFVGSGVSGGETGARFGPSLMAGGNEAAWPLIEPVWKDIAAKVDPKTGKEIGGAAPGEPVRGGEACAAWIGAGGAGHFVKMVHNGIEYGDMQMICEAYDVLRRVGGMSPAELADVFASWNEGELDSYLIEITADILRQTDPKSGKPFVDVVLDAAGQKGTGKWTSVAALDLGVPAPTIAEAVFARCLSAIKAEREGASRVLRGPSESVPKVDRARLVEQVRDALLCSKYCSYAQGFRLMSAAAAEQGWTPDFATIARIWRGGCIIRARFLQRITDAYTRRPDLPDLLQDEYFVETIGRAQAGWREVAALGARAGVPLPTFSSALAHYDGYRSERLPANLLQAQRDYFGAHTYERVDAPRGEFFHLDWTAPGRPQVGA